MVLASSFMVAAKVSSPTGPPPNLSIIEVKRRISILSSPSSSTSSISSACLASASVTESCSITDEKSLTRFKSLFAIRGVPRLRFATSIAASSSISAPSVCALRFTISASSLVEYGSSLHITPNLSRRGELNIPARVVAPTKVNLLSGICTERAEGPLPIIKSSEKSSIAGYKISSTL